MDVTVSSQFMIKLMETLEACEDEVVVSDIKAVVRYLWDKNRAQLYVYSSMFWLYTLLNYIIIIWCRSKEACEAFLLWAPISNIVHLYAGHLCLFLFVLLITYEFIVLYRRKLKYLLSIYNIFDIMGYLCFLPIYIFILPDKNLDEDSFLNFCLSLYLLLLGLRSTIHLRVVDGIRHLIAMLWHVFVDMRFFLTVFVLYIVLFAAIETEITKSGGVTPFEPGLFPFFIQILNVYSISFGELPGLEDYTWL